MSGTKSLTTKAYNPAPGDIVWTDFDPRTGREQGGRRPAVVVSDISLYHASGFVILCPITSKIRPFPSSVVLDDASGISGEIFTYQIRSIDTSARPLVYSGTSLSAAKLTELREKLAVLLGIE